LREYAIPHLRQSGRISIPEESFERIREARDLHKEGLGTESVRRLLREGSGPDAGNLQERLDQLSESLEGLRAKPAPDEMLPSHALRTILARQNLLISAMFDLTEMVEELLLASGKPRKALFEDVEGEIREVTPPLERDARPQLIKTSKGVPASTKSVLETLPESMDLPARRTRFGALARRRRRGVLVVLSVLVTVVLLGWALPTFGGELAPELPFFDQRGAGSSPDDATPKDGGAARNPPAEGEAPDPAAGSGSSDAGGAGGAEVPEVSDRGVVEAARILSRAGFEVGAVKTVASQEAAGTIMRTEPTAGTTVEPGTPVVLVMSGGPTGTPPGTRSEDAAGAAQYTN
jgi:hypothetical protein